MTFEMAAPRRRPFGRILDRTIVICLIVGVILLLLWPTIFVVVKPGNVAVLFRLFGGGTETQFEYREGLVVKWPWNRLYVYEVRTQSRQYALDALSENGLTIHVEFTTMFHPDIDAIGLLHKEVGPGYVERIVGPVSIDAVRQTVGRFDPHEIYAISATAMQTEIEARLREHTRGSHIQFEAVIITKLELPEPVNTAINDKLAQEQYAQSYVYRIQREKSEAERKHIEAIGIQNFYSIVADALTPALLTWRGMEATIEVARSPNSKVVIIGGGKDQLPLILGSDIGNLPTPPKAASGPPEPHPLPEFSKLPPLFPKGTTP